jgi:hypothetical protein
MILERQIRSSDYALRTQPHRGATESGTTHGMSSPRAMRPALAVVLATLLSVFAAARPALAHPDLDEGKRLAGELELETALVAFERALASGSLTRSELIELLAERAFVLHALQRRSELVQDFVWLSALDPNHRLDLRAPPDLTAIWTSVRDQGRGPIQIQLEASGTEEGLTARTSLGGTVPEGVRSQIVRRRAGESWEKLEGPELREPQPENATVELYAQAVGLGDVVIAHHYSPDSPLRVTMTPTESAPPSGAAPRDEPASWTRRNRSWIIGAAAVVAAAVVVGTVLAVRGKGEDKSDQTNLQPMVTF